MTYIRWPEPQYYESNTRIFDPLSFDFGPRNIFTFLLEQWLLGQRKVHRYHQFKYWWPVLVPLLREGFWWVFYKQVLIAWFHSSRHGDRTNSSIIVKLLKIHAVRLIYFCMKICLIYLRKEFCHYMQIHAKTFCHIL